MRVLLDTNVFLWWLDDNRRLTREIADLIADPSSEVWISVASLWEIAIKSGLGRLRFDWQAFNDHVSELDFGRLGIEITHCRMVQRLPSLYRDPFDRMLIAQATVERLTLVTSDEKIDLYDVSVLRV